MSHPQNITSSLVPAAHVAESIHWLRSIAEPGQLWLPGIEFAPTKVRAHGLRDAHVWPLVARIKGESFGCTLRGPGPSRPSNCGRRIAGRA